MSISLPINRVSWPPFCLIVIGLSLFYYVANPYWYGDALWYALDITNGPLKDTDAGRLIWRPLGMLVWRASRILSPDIPILDVLQLLGAFGAALGPLLPIFLPVDSR